MITKEAFLKFINTYIEFETKCEEISKGLNISLWECTLTEYPGMLLDQFLDIIFDSSAREVIYWWMFEKRFNPSLKLWNKESRELSAGTLDDVWEIIKNQQL